MTEVMTVGELRRELNGLPEDTKLIFGGGLTFYRLKRWSDDEFVVQFNEIEAELAPSFKKKHPSVIVAFCRFDMAGEIALNYVPRLT